MAHSIDVWRLDFSTDNPPLAVSLPASASDLVAAEESDQAVIELCRQYPALPRAIAEYLAR